MCGIALILSGIHIIGYDLFREPIGASSSAAEEVAEPVIPIDDLKAALLRRGPDSFGSRKVFLQLKQINSVEEEGSERDRKGDLSWQVSRGCITSALEAASTQDVRVFGMKSVAELDFLGATLQLRGLSPVFQPLVDTSGNLLVYNGEIFGGVHVAADGSDSKALLDALERCCSCDCYWLEKACSCIGDGVKSVPEILSVIRGPWALIYWQGKSKTIWFGRDAFGRRSLLVHWPTFDDSRFVLSSVSPPSSVRRDFICEPEAADMTCKLCYWEELPCGIYSIHLKASEPKPQGIKEILVGEVRRHGWGDLLLEKLVKWERISLNPKFKELCAHGISLEKDLWSLPTNVSEGMQDKIGDLGDLLIKQTKLQSGCIQPAQRLVIALRESVMRRTTQNFNFQTSLEQEEEVVPVALLFSGGLDSMILAALLDQCLNSRYTIDLLNVSFDGQIAPDRVSARAGVKELQRIAPFRRWRLVEIDATLANLTWETKHLMSLIHPAKTYMDLNIGIALWLAAGGVGWVDGEICHPQEDQGRYKYKSSSRILLVGSGADEQCAGYSRHRTKYRQGGWIALQEEMRLDMQRIWKRNLGRDDRCISDHGKEARFPFLDEDVIKTLLEIPLWEIAELDEPVGRGDKKILREVARFLGLEGAAVLPKRAIQFGSRIARESNRKNFGSNRAANQASAGSVNIHGPTS